MMRMQVTTWQLVLFALVFAAHPVRARPPIALGMEEGTRLSAEYLDLDASTLQARSGAISGARSRVLARYVSADSGWSVAFGHEYNALEISLAGPQPQANGDLHTLHLAGSWQRPLAGGSLQLAIAPAISVSSNALKNPDVIDEDSVQLWGAALWRGRGPRWDWILGVAHDYRFGEARAYPLAGMAWEGERVSLWATYPDVVLDWSISDSWSASVSVAPDGNQWQAFDRPLERSSDFRRQAWQTELRIAYRWRSGLRLGLAAGRFWDQRWRFDLEDGERLRTDSEDSAYVGLRVDWFPE